MNENDRESERPEEGNGDNPMPENADPRLVRAETPALTRRQSVIALAVTVAVAVAAALSYLIPNGVFTMAEPGRVIGHLANALIFPAVFYLCFAGLIFAKRQGLFDGVTYSLRYFFNAIVPQFWLNKDERGGRFPKYQDYKNRKRQKEQRRFNMTKCFLLVGGACLLLSILFTVLMNVFYPGTDLYGAVSSSGVAASNGTLV